MNGIGNYLVSQFMPGSADTTSAPTTSSTPPPGVPAEVWIAMLNAANGTNASTATPTVQPITSSGGGGGGGKSGGMSGMGEAIAGSMGMGALAGL